MDPQVSKSKGNAAFKAQDFRAAILHYSTAIANSIDPADPLFYSNRAQAYLQVAECVYRPAPPSPFLFPLVPPPALPLLPAPAQLLDTAFPTPYPSTQRR